jgi:DNA-binding FadR family transcriptional regulator
VQVLTSSSDPCLRFILNVHNEDNIVTSSPRKHVLTVELREHYTDVIQVCISWNESVKEEDHANVTLVIRSMEVDVDTFTEVDIELHITVTKGSVNPVVIRTNNC